MAFRRHKPIWLLLVALLVGVPLVASALIGPKNVDPEMRVFTRDIPQLVVPASTETTVGQGGVIIDLDLYTTATVAAPTAQTPAIGAFPYPAKVIVDLVDGGSSSGSLTCTSLAIAGRNQFGERTSETLTTLTETEQTSARVYSEITKLTAAGCDCSGVCDTSDQLNVRVSSWIGLPGKIRSANDIVSMCIKDDSATPDVVICYRGGGTVASSQESLDEAGAVDLDDSAVDVSDATLDTPAAVLDHVSLVVFSPVPLP